MRQTIRFVLLLAIMTCSVRAFAWGKPGRALRTPAGMHLATLHADRALRDRLRALPKGRQSVTLAGARRGSLNHLLRMTPRGLEETTYGDHVRLNWNPLQLMTMWVGLLDTRHVPFEQVDKLHVHALDETAARFGSLTPRAIDRAVADHFTFWRGVP